MEMSYIMPTVATSSCKVKYISACRAVKEHMATFWNLLNFLGYEQGKSTSIQSDNMATIYIIKDLSLRDPTVSICNITRNWNMHYIEYNRRSSPKLYRDLLKKLTKMLAIHATH